MKKLLTSLALMTVVACSSGTGTAVDSTTVGVDSVGLPVDTLGKSVDTVFTNDTAETFRENKRLFKK